MHKTCHEISTHGDIDVYSNIMQCHQIILEMVIDNPMNLINEALYLKKRPLRTTKKRACVPGELPWIPGQHETHCVTLPSQLLNFTFLKREFVHHCLNFAGAGRLASLCNTAIYRCRRRGVGSS